MPETPPAIDVRGLAKRFGDVRALDGFDLRVDPGTVHGLVGPNGAGKTTFLRVLFGLVTPDEGSVVVLGDAPDPNRGGGPDGVAGFVEEPRCYPYLTARRNLELLADLDGVDLDLVDDVLEMVRLGDRADRKVGGFSSGMRQRLGLAAALLRSPRLLILDEPTNGLDPRGIHDVRSLLAELNAAGTTVFMSSHQLSEVEQLCTRIGVVDRGRVVLQDDLAALRGPTGRVVVQSPDADRAAAMLGSRVVARTDDRLIVADGEPAAVNAELAAAGLRVSEIGAERRSLEELVLSLTSAGSDRFDGAVPAAPQERAVGADESAAEAGR